MEVELAMVNSQFSIIIIFDFLSSTEKKIFSFFSHKYFFTKILFLPMGILKLRQHFRNAHGWELMI